MNNLTLVQRLILKVFGRVSITVNNPRNSCDHFNLLVDTLSSALYVPRYKVESDIKHWFDQVVVKYNLEHHGWERFTITIYKNIQFASVNVEIDYDSLCVLPIGTKPGHKFPMTQFIV